MGFLRAFFNGSLATWITTSLLLTVERIRSIIAWSFLIIDSNQEASKFILMGFLKLFRRQISFFTFLGVIFLFFGSFLVGILSKTENEAFLGFIFFLIVLTFFSLMEFTSLSLLSNPFANFMRIFSGGLFLLIFPVDLLAFPLALLGVRVTSSE